MDLVVFSNHMNKMNLGILKDKELDLFMSICLKLRDEGTKKIELEFSELKELANYEIKNYQRFLNDLRGVNKKLLMLNCEYETDTEISGFVLFTDYTIHKIERKLTIQVNEKFKYILNELTENFTKFELNQFVGLNSQYSKTIFRLLKQFSGTGWREFLLSDFRELLSIPEKYRMSEIDKYVLNKQIIAELKESFTELKVLKIKKGREVYKIRFEWEVLTVLPPSEEDKKKKEQEEKAKIIEKQSEYEQNLNKKTKKEKLKVSELEFNLKWFSFVKENNLDVKDPNIDIVFKTFSKGFEVEKGDIEVSEEPTREETILEEPKEEMTEREKEIFEEAKQSLEKFEVPLFIIHPETEAEIEANKIIKKLFPWMDEELYTEDIDYVCSTLRRKKMYKELEILDKFLEKKQAPVINPKDDIYKDDKCLGLSEWGKDYIENYIKEHNLEHLLVSEKTKKEIKGSARESRLIKLYKNNFKEN